MSDQPQPPRRWHYDPTINLGHIVTTLTLIVAVVVAFVRLEGRIDQAGLSIRFLDQQLAQQRADMQTTIVDVRALLRRIEDKLDRKVDKP